MLGSPVLSGFLTPSNGSCFNPLSKVIDPIKDESEESEGEEDPATDNDLVQVKLNIISSVGSWTVLN